MKYSIIIGSMKTEKSYESKKKTKYSVLLFLVLLLVSLLGMVILRMQLGENGTTAVVTVDGEEYYSGSLFVEKEVSVNDTNTLVVKDGMVKMIFAECPDQICVKHEPISKVGESIICLPNKVVVQIESLTGQRVPAEGEVDAVVK